MIKELFHFFDFSVRKACSYLLRAVLILLTTTLYFLNPSSMPFYAYVPLVLAYLALFYVFRKTYDWSAARGVIDLAFLCVSLSQLESDAMAKTLVFVLLLVDYPNSSRDRYKWYESLGYLLGWGLSLSISTHFRVPIELVLSVLSYSVFIIIFRSRSRFMSVIEEIEAKTIEFFEEVKEKGTHTSQELLRNLRELATKYLQIRVNEIHCFLEFDNVRSILHSTSFVVNYSLKLPDKGLGPFNDDNAELVVDGGKVQHLYCIRIPTQAYSFVYFFDVSQKLLPFREGIVDKFTRKPLIFVSKVFAMNTDFERKNVELQDAYNLKAISLDAIHASTHYMKNNLSPLKGYLDSVGLLLSRLNTESTSADFDYLRTNYEQVKNSLRDIEAYSLRVVEDTRKAISDFPTHTCNYEAFVIGIRDHWTRYFRSEPKITFSNPISDDERGKQFEIRDHYLHGLFDNIMSNVFKHSTATGGVELEFRMNSLFIKISSQGKKETFQVLSQLVKYFVDSQRSEEVVRTSYNGIHLIKSHADKLGAVVRPRCLGTDSTVVWELQFKEIDRRLGSNENSSS